MFFLPSYKSAKILQSDKFKWVEGISHMGICSSGSWSEINFSVNLHIGYGMETSLIFFPPFISYFNWRINKQEFSFSFEYPKTVFQINPRRVLDNLEISECKQIIVILPYAKKFASLIVMASSLRTACIINR